MSTTREQQLSSLAEANRIRMARADLKRKVKRGEVSVAEILAEEIPDWLERMSLYELLDAIPRMRKTTIAKIFAQAGNMSFSRTVGRVTTRQRFILIPLVAAFENRRRRTSPTREMGCC